MVRLVQGIGLNERTRTATINKVMVLEYGTWKGMLKRCYCDKFKKLFPTYDGCTVSDNFKSYEYFYDWCQNQIGFGFDGYQLDKDLLMKGNKIYSESLCVFIPQEINYAIRYRLKKQSDLPIGVSINPWSGRYIASIKGEGITRHIGTYDDPHQAFLAYKAEKENQIKWLANKYKMEIDNRAYDALMKFDIDP